MAAYGLRPTLNYLRSLDPYEIQRHCSFDEHLCVPYFGNSKKTYPVGETVSLRKKTLAGIRI